ncbi:MAG: NAD(P)-dependent alcohol dehydrogenase [Pseudonocardiaceae bacterium]
MTVKAYAAKTAMGMLERYDYETGPLGTADVEIQVTHCGICHSDIAMIDDDWASSQYPLVPGHEVIGIITAVGANVSGIRQVGQRVGVGWQAGSCGRCEWCARGKENLCAAGRPTIIGRHGGWASAVYCQAEFAVPLPDQLPSDNAGPLMCAGATVFTPMVEYCVMPWMRTAVVGIGGLGHLAVQFLAKFGCEVTAISSSHSKDADARTLGAARFLATTGTDELKKAAGTFDFILSTVSADIPWGDYLAALRPQGRLVIVGVPQSDIRFPVGPLLAERSVSGGAVGSPSDIARMLKFAARAGVVARVEQFPIADVNRAVDHVRSGRARFRAVLVA